jgi:dephospho-CoA kinase
VADYSSLVVVLTGGIASGKSAAADVFHRLEVPVFDADVIARDLVRPGQSALKEITAAFDHEVLSPSGDLDRRRMRERIFADADERRKLETILHPKVRAALLASATTCKDPYCILTVPLLVESIDDYRWVDRILVIDALPETQFARLMQRDGTTRDAAFRILAAQASREQRLVLADDVIDNVGTPEALSRIVERLHRRYLGLAALKLNTQKRVL